MFTDNIVFEAGFYKGTSSSKKLFDLHLRLRVAMMKGDITAHMIHIAGTRMKGAGVDGLSRGDLLEGIMAHVDPLSFIPLNESCDERGGSVIETWIRAWWGQEELLKLAPDQWFIEAQKGRDCLWMPPPAAAPVAVEVLAEAKLKRPDSAHILVIPRLMTHLWRKALRKDADLFFDVPVGTSLWQTNMHEPLTVFLLLPLVRHRAWKGPWVLRGSNLATTSQKKLEWGFARAVGKRRSGHNGLGRELWEVWKDVETGSGDILRKFLNDARSIPTLSKSVVRKMLQPAPLGKVPLPKS